MLNRDVNAIVRHLSALAKSLNDEPSKWNVVMRATQAVADGIKEKNPRFDAEDFIRRVLDF